MTYDLNDERIEFIIDKSLQPYFVPFSTGVRGCIGCNTCISYLEQTVFIASLAHRFEFALQSPD